MKWITADTHFGHKNVIEYSNRPFDSVEEMDAELICRWNRVVGTHDTIYHLGDFALTTKKRKIEILKQLNGYKILIRGNHDKTISHCESVGFDEVHDSLIVGNCLMKHVGFKHIPVLNVGVDNWDYYPIPLPTPDSFLMLCGHSHRAFFLRCGAYLE